MLVEICAVDTSPRADVAAAGRAESQVFDILEREIKSFDLPGASLERKPINPAIADHPFFSQLYYTRSDAHPEGLDARDCYDGRCNLLLTLAGDQADGGGAGQAVNAHIDTVSPHIPPRVEGDLVFGRGSNDDKGNVVVLLGALKLLGEYLRSTGRRLNRDLVGMLVIEEETGGNGSLSLAMDRQLKQRYDSMMVLECCDGGIHPANRGALWYKVAGRLADVNLFEASAFIIEEMENEGRAIRDESDHSLFPHRPVQTCHGIIGNCGEHPSRINADVSFEISLADKPNLMPLAGDILEEGLAEYVELYGDKTQPIDPAGKPKVDHHYELTAGPAGLAVRVLGSSGHMGSILANDGAITKMAAMVRALVRRRGELESAAGKPVQMRLKDWPDASDLLLEGGQGFLPTHDMPQVQQRLTQAVLRGAGRHFQLVGCDADPAKALHVTYDKLHNAAFAGEANSPDMQNAIAAARAAKMYKDGPIRGWDVSCDARIFACEYPDMAVLTTGAGALACAHADDEHVNMKDVAQAAKFLAYFILAQTGTTAI